MADSFSARSLKFIFVIVSESDLVIVWNDSITVRLSSETWRMIKIFAPVLQSLCESIIAVFRDYFINNLDCIPRYRHGWVLWTKYKGTIVNGSNLF